MAAAEPGDVAQVGQGLGVLGPRDQFAHAQVEPLAEAIDVELAARVGDEQFVVARMRNRVGSGAGRMVRWRVRVGYGTDRDGGRVGRRLWRGHGLSLRRRAGSSWARARRRGVALARVRKCLLDKAQKNLWNSEISSGAGAPARAQSEAWGFGQVTHDSMGGHTEDGDRAMDLRGSGARTPGNLRLRRHRPAFRAAQS